MNIRFPKQLFINGEFVNATSGKTLKVINPADETLICEVSVTMDLRAIPQNYTYFR